MQCSGSYEEEEEEEEEANKAVQCPMLWRQSRSMRCCIYIYHVHVVGRTDIHRTKEQAYVVYSLRTLYVLFIPIPIPINGPARGKQAS